MFQPLYGCGKSWCFQCGKKYCGKYYDISTGKKSNYAKDNHNLLCCKLECNGDENKLKEEYCEGGHSSHCLKRW